MDMIDDSVFTAPTAPGPTQSASIESPKSGIDIGTVNIAIDSSSVDSFIARLERALAAFKAEWNKV